MANDYPFEEIVQAVDDHAAKGHLCFQKFTCEQCGNRMGMDEANVLYKLGTCDKCGHTTDIEKNGCNYMLMIGLGRKTA